MSRRKPSPFAGITNREEFTEVLQEQLGNLTVADMTAATLLCKLKGWGNPAETSEASVTPTVESPLFVVDAPEPNADGLWRWRPSSGDPWSRGLTAEEMAQEYDRIAAERLAARAVALAAAIAAANNPAGWVMVGDSPRRHVSVDVLTPKGINQSLYTELPCTVEKLDALNEEQDPRNLDHW